MTQQTQAPSSHRAGACLAGLCALASMVHGQDAWPSFRNGGSGTVTADGLPTHWSPDENIAWRAPIPGYGQSAPVVHSDTVFVTSCDGAWQQRGFVHAFDLTTGEKRWTTEVPATTKVENYFRNSRAAPACVVDERVVVSFFPGGDLTAMDHTGKTLWTVALFADLEVKNERATASSLAQTDDLVFAVVDHHGPSFAIALRKADGSVAWRADRGERIPSWSSPLVTQHAGRELLVMSSANTVDAYDAATGERLWQLDGLHGNLIPSAAVAGDSVYVGANQPFHSRLGRGDAAASNCRLRLVQQDGKPSYEVVWRARRAKSAFSSPLAFGAYVYYVAGAGILYCLDRETGEEVFRQRIGSECWASAIGVRTARGEDLAYFVMKDGETLVLRPGRTFDQVARNVLWSEDEKLAAADAARAKRNANAVPQDEAPPQQRADRMLDKLPEKALHGMFSYGDPIAYAAIVAEGRLLVRSGQGLICIATPAAEPGGKRR